MAPETPAPAKKDVPVIDPAFRSIQKGHAAFLIWRVEKLQLVPVPKEQYGSFYSGDCYIIFSACDNSQAPGINVKSREIRGLPDMRIHFWLGEHASQDEAGVSAIKTVELDDLLGGTPIQHREVQGSESERFRGYFPGGIRYMEGGVGSGLSHVELTIKPKLYQVKGKRRPIFRELRSISWSSMNEGDVFVLSTKNIQFVWYGKSANNYEKMQGSKLTQKIRTERGGGQIVTVEDGEENDLPSDEKEAFSEFLPLDKKALGAATKDEDDATHERLSVEQLKLYRCSDAHGTFEVVEIKNGPLLQTDLDQNDSFIIDNQKHGIWVWIGKKATKTERTEAMRNAQGFINKKGYPPGTPIVRVIDGGEPVEFKGLFKGWHEKHQVAGTGLSKGHSFNRIAQTVQTQFDASTLHDNPALAASSQMVDDGSGTKQIWRAENFDLKPIDPKYYGAFYAGDCYVILYTYFRGSAECHIIYYWIGAKSTADEQGTAALKTIEMDDQYAGEPVQVRVVQGKEPPHFMAMFKGKMVIFEGGRASGFANSNQKDEQGVKDTFLLHVRGYSKFDTKAIEVPRKASSLNSNDVFVLFTKASVYIWAGKGSTGDEREAAKLIASKSPRESVMIFEGSEKPDFWEAIGGKEPYASEKRLQEAAPERKPRLFHCSNASGRFSVEEIVDFNQDDLIADDVMLLDTGDAIFMWIGDGANAEEKKKAEEIAKDYLRTDPMGRDDSTPIMRIKQGYEPPNFSGFFGIWDNSRWTKRPADGERSVPSGSAPVNINLERQVSAGGVPKFPLSRLRSMASEELPEGVDAQSKEVYLNEEDFRAVFRMSYNDFSQLPPWKRTALKKSAGLF
ncbi:villin-1-like [Paramacrobiotus metropolitanus]|uniref:villin-1-like n=1 Tax=Paramacrobiotus metropolitanus TaxID=2943436 RepID=UPI00244566BF|nr:villin-1-like [Paramacrobiotus metropolitanus]